MPWPSPSSSLRTFTVPGQFGARFALAATLIALSLGLFIHGPSLKVGFRGDDYVQWAMAEGQFVVPRSSWDLFDFASGAAQENRRLMDFGHLPWWSAPALRLRMWRPIASALMAFDFAHLGTRADLHHWHSLAWFALLLLAAARVLFQLLPKERAALALIIYAVSPCHTLPVGWIANRSTLLATALSFAAIELHVRRAVPGRLRTAATIALASVALLSGEYAVAALVYAFMPWHADWNWRARWPVLLPLLAYVALHSWVGSDVVGSGYYLSPLRQPWAFVQALLTRGPVLAADLMLSLPSAYFQAVPPLRNQLLLWHVIPPELWIKLPDWRVWHVLIGYGAVVMTIALVRWLARDAACSRALRGFVFAAACSLVPVAGSLPEDRLLVAASLGGAVLFACALAYACSQARGAGSGRARLAYVALSLCLAAVPVRGLWRSYQGARDMVFGAHLARAWGFAADLPDAAQRDARVYLLTNPDFNSSVNLPWLRHMYGQPLPQSYRRLCPGALPVDVTRSADRVLEVHVLTNAVRGSAVPSLYRAASLPMQRGDHVELPGLRVEVLDVFDDNPSQLRFTFDRSLDDPALWILEATERGLKRWRAPALGQTERVPYAFVRDLT